MTFQFLHRPGLIWLGALLLSCNLAGSWLPNHEPIASPVVPNSAIPGFDVAVRDSRELSRMVSVARSAEGIALEELTMAVCLSSRHSDSRRIGLSENWLLWLIGKAYAPAARTQSTTRLIAGGVANCSERCQILKSLLEQSGIASRFVGLNGHVVLEVLSANGWQVADPDFGATYSLSLEQLQSGEGNLAIEAALTNRGFSSHVIQDYIGWFVSTSDNVSLPVGQPLSPRLWRLEVLADWLKWLIPAALLLIGGLSQSPRVSHDRDVIRSDSFVGLQPAA